MRRTNISLRITSSGLVSAAPATPAATDLAAARHSTCPLWPGSSGPTLGGGSQRAMKSFTEGYPIHVKLKDVDFLRLQVLLELA